MAKGTVRADVPQVSTQDVYKSKHQPLKLLEPTRTYLLKESIIWKPAIAGFWGSVGFRYCH